MSFLMFIFFSPLWANPIELSESKIVESAMNHFPLVLSSYQNVIQYENIYRKTYGELDLKIVGLSNAYLSGFYNGDAYRVALEKELEFINTKLYAGEKWSYGDFPDYEMQYKTTAGGEPLVGIKFDLLRNIFIDQKRLDILNTKIEADSSLLQLKQVKLEISYAASEAYWQFITANERLNLAKKYLNLSLERMDKLKRRILKGDLAEIYAVENETYILKRKNQVLEELKNLIEKTYLLSLFFRDNGGKPIVLLDKNFNYKTEQIKLYDEKLKSELIERASIENPEIKLADNKLLQIKNEIRLAETNFWPELNLGLEYIKNRSINSGLNVESETKMLLKLEIPIEYNKMLGDYRSKKADLNIYQYQRQFKIEKIDAKIRTILKKIDYTYEKYLNASKEVSLAQKLIYSEMKKFQLGASDFFVVNIREQNWVQAFENKIMSQLDYFLLKAEAKKVAALETI